MNSIVVATISPPWCGWFVPRSVLLLVLALFGSGLELAAQGVIPGAVDVEFTARHDGTKQRYLMWLPSEKPKGILMALHGHGSDRHQFMNAGRDETKAAIEAARKYQMIYVSPDYRATTSWMGPSAEADCLQIIEELKARHQVRNVVLCGASMGGSAALTFAVLHPELVQGVVSMNGTANHLEYDQFQDAIRTSFGGDKKEKFEEYKKRSAEYWPEKLSMPVAIVACGKDDLVPPGSVMRLAKILKKLNRPVHLIYRENEGHSTKLADAEEAFRFVMEAI